MATKTFNAAADNFPAPTSPSAGISVDLPFSATIDASADITAANDKLRIAKLPAGCVPVDAFVAMADLDGGSALVWDLGIEDTTQSPTDTTDADALIAASTVGQAAGTARMDESAGLAIAPVNYDRFFTITVTTPPGTDQDGLVSGWVRYRPAIRGE